MKSTYLPTFCALVALLLLSACSFDVPLTATSTRPVDARLIGNWTHNDQETLKIEHMNVRKLDESTYIIAYDGDLYRAFHSDFAQRPFVSVQNLNDSVRKYSYFVWQLSEDGHQLSLRAVSDSVISDQTKDIATMQRLITENQANPKLLGEEIVFALKN